MNKLAVKETNERIARLKTHNVYVLRIKCRNCKYETELQLLKGEALKDYKCVVCESKRLERL